VYADGKVCVSILHAAQEEEVFNEHEPPETKYIPLQ
jgi:hypothetical protein